MRYSITISLQAKSDLKNIYQYIANELQAKMTSVRQLERIETAIASHEDMPERFRRYDKGKWCEMNLRFMPVDNYLVFYVLDKDTCTVTILRIMYGGRDIDRALDNTK